LAAQNIWQENYEPVAFCESEEFCCKVLKKHWPDVEIINDINNERIRHFEQIDLLTAGVPCQPASISGKKRGTADDRWLWPVTLDTIRAVRPRYAILENVPNLFALQEGNVFGGILSRLAEIGYDCWWEIIPACAVGAPHKRDRIWIVAHNSSDRCMRCNERSGIYGQNKTCDEADKRRSNVADTEGNSIGAGLCKSKQERIGRGRFGDGGGKITAYPKKQGLEGQKSARQLWQQNRLSAECSQWAVEPDVGRVADGIPNRVDRLKCLGNAIVVQVAMVIMRAIKRSDE